MPDEFDDIFTSEEAFRNYLKHSVDDEFFSEGSIDNQWQFWRELGSTITRQDYRDLARDRLGIAFHERDIRRLGGNEEIPDRWYYERHGWQLTDTYLYQFDVTLQNELTGEITHEVRAMVRNTTLTKGELEELEREILKVTSPPIGFELMNVELKGALISA